MPRPLPGFASILTRRIVPAVVTAVGVVGASAAILLWFHAQDDLRGEQNAAAQSVADLVAGELRIAQSRLGAIAKAMDSIETREGGRTGLLTEAGRNTPGMAAVMLVNSSDTVTDVVLQKTNPAISKALIGLNFARMREFAEARDGREPRLAPGILDERRLLMLAEPLERGALVLLVDPATVAQTKEPAGGGFVVLLDEAGMPFSFSPSAPSAALHEIGRTVSAPPKQRPSSLTTGETSFFATRVSIPGTPWTAMLCASRLPAYASYYRSLAIIATVSLLVAGAASLAVHLLARYITLPLGALPDQSNEEELPGLQPSAELEAIAHRIRRLSSQLQEKVVRLRRVSDILAYVAEGPASRPYKDFFQALAYELSSATQARCVLITEWIAGAKPRAEILAARCTSALPDDFRYELMGNPCHQLADKPFVHIQQGATQLYPESPLLTMVGAEGYVAVALVMGDGSIGGHIEIISDQQLIVEPELKDLLWAVATRSAAELERIRVNRQLKEETQRHEISRADTCELVCRWMPSGTITYASETMLRWYGEGRELVGTSIFDLVREEDRPRLAHHIEHLESTPLPLDLQLQLPDDSRRAVRIVLRAIRDAHGRVTEYQGTAVDTTAAREGEVELSQARQLVELIRANTPIALWMSDWGTHRCVWASASMASIWPISAEELAKTPMAWTTVIHEEDRQRVARSYLLHAGEGLYHEEYRICLPNGTVRWIRDKAVPLRAPDGSVSRVVNFAEIIDIA